MFKSLIFVLILAACGSTTEVGTSSGDVPEVADNTESENAEADITDSDITDSDSADSDPVEPPASSLPLADDEVADDEEPLPPVDDEVANGEDQPVTTNDEHIITNDAIVDPQVTTPTELLLNPDNDTELWVRFTGGDPNCTAASATVLTETPEAVQVELLVGITEDALARSCMAGEFDLRVNVALNESGAGKSLAAVQAATDEAPLVTPELSTDDFVGLTQADAEALADENILIWRTVRIDDQQFAVTRDFNPGRLNFEVDDGIVTKVTLG